MAFKLKLTSWKWLAGVDAGAQGEISNVALVKRAPTGDEYTITCKVGKVDETLGVVFGYAFATTLDGGKSAHVDLQDDAIVGGDELIKVALGFVEAGAQSDVMHNEKRDGYCPFVMPLNAETKKAFKLAGDVEGVAIGMKPSAETFKRFQSGELQGFSIGGTGIREPLDEQKRAPEGKVAKAALYTNEVDGHAHKICIYDDGSLYVEYATMAGADSSHSHGIIRGEDGTLTILADSGHSHVLAEGQPSLVVVDANAIVVVAQHAPAAKSTRSIATPKVDINPATPSENATMKTDAEKIADLTKRNERLERIAKLSPAHFGHMLVLSLDAQDEFLAKSTADRDAVIAEVVKRDDEANKVVYVSKSDGAVYRAKDDARMIDMAKRLDAQADEIEKADIRKAAAELLGGKAPGSDETHDDIVRSLRKSGLPKERIDAMTAAVKGLVEVSKLGKGAAGAGGSDTPTSGDSADTLAALEKGLVEFCKAQKIEKHLWTVGLDAFKQTTEGAALKRAYDESTAS
jgi:hypothetical protein